MDILNDKTVTLVPITLENLEALVKELNNPKHPHVPEVRIKDYLGEIAPKFIGCNVKGRLFFSLPLCEIRRKRLTGKWCDPIERYSIFFQRYPGENVVVAWYADNERNTLDIISGRVLDENLGVIQILLEGGQLRIKHDSYSQELYGYTECTVQMINRRMTIRGPEEIKEVLEGYLEGLEINHPHRNTYENAIEALFEDSIM